VILFTHPTGNANVRHAALALDEAGLLGEYLTCLDLRPPRALAPLLPGKLRRQLERRALPTALAAHARTRPTRELLRHLCPRLGLGHLSRHEVGPFSVDGVYRDLDRAAARRLADPRFTALYAYEDGAEAGFAAARALGKRTLYDLPIGYWRAAHTLLREEAERQPAWAATLPTLRDSPAKTARKDAELATADLVLCASSFTRDTLRQAPAFHAPVAVIPYGAPELPADLPARAPRPAGAPLRALFVGSLGQRKGLSYLFAAARRLGPAGLALTVVGRPPALPCPALDAELARVRWLPTLSHRGILEEMARHDVFVFPSLFEGFGLVLLEAMACGLPLLATPHTAAPDLITDGREGFIVPIREAEALAERLERWQRDPALCATMGEAARRRAATFTWPSYHAGVLAAVGPALDRSASASSPFALC
jgi:alpha-maltose-1-phosphate synthase